MDQSGVGGIEAAGVEVESTEVLCLPTDSIAVVITTWALAYLSERGRVAFRETLRAASKQRPIAWISGESSGVVDLFEDIDVLSDSDGTEASILGLAMFDGGDVEPELLGFVHPHGNWLDWRAAR